MWQPSSTPETLRARADLFARIRAFFAGRGVLEVDTPILSQHATVDRHIESFFITSPQPLVPSPRFWLHTSPEFAMKRLLASGCGPIYQIVHVFRSGETGRLHNPEFAMLEWYRPDWDHHRLMDEVEALVRACGVLPEFERLGYRETFLNHAGFDPFTASLYGLRSSLEKHGVAPPQVDGIEAQDRDFWLDLWMSAVVAPKLGSEAPVFVYDFPESQAALARVRPGEPPVAERFELFWRGVELANGFHELTDAREQHRRFESDRAWRRAQGRVVPPCDENLLAALAEGLPDCSGVALGLDRLLMLLRGETEIARVMPFDAERA